MRMIWAYSGVILSVVLAGSVLAEPKRSEDVRYCGEMYAPPYFQGANPGRRDCPQRAERAYISKYGGIAKQALDMENDACFVPDSSYQLLDDIVDTVRDRAQIEGLKLHKEAARHDLERLSNITGDVLEDKGFKLEIPTETLGDALTFLDSSDGSPLHTIDCDTSSLILLEIAQSYGLPASLVDITLRSGSGHNYVRWELSDGSYFDWDTNGRAVCLTPPDLPGHEGRSLTKNETQAYLHLLRAPIWKKQSRFSEAISDFQKSMELHPEVPTAYNNYAWLVATNEFTGRENQIDRAIEAARFAVSLDRQANYLDTLGCALALDGQFDEAAEAQAKAVSEAPWNQEFKDRLNMFLSEEPQDCTGID